MAGVQPAKMIQALSGSARSKRGLQVPRAEMPSAGADGKNSRKMPGVMGLPLLKAIVGAHGVPGDRRSSLRTIPAAEIIGAPAAWCPNPAYTSLLKVKGHSMEPLIRNGDLVAGDSLQIERADLYGKIVIAFNEQNGLWVSRFSRYDTLDVLEAENRQYDPVILNKAAGWRILARVLWWISAAP
jgi:hypothetical protein